jgi:hypothetical protein
MNGVIVAAQQSDGGHLELVSVNGRMQRQVIPTGITGDRGSPHGRRTGAAGRRSLPSDAPRAVWVIDATARTL